MSDFQFLDVVHTAAHCSLKEGAEDEFGNIGGCDKQWDFVIFLFS